MKQPITINYHETAFTLRWDENRQVIHDQVYQTLLQGKHIPREVKTRPFLYDVTLLDSASNLALATVRSHEKPEAIQSEAASLTVQNGDTLSFRVRVSACTHRSESEGDRRRTIHSFVPAHDIEPWATALLARNGLSASNIKLLDYEKRQVHKRNHRFGINEAHLEVQATIESTVDFTKAYLNGLGRQKGYGLGLIEVVK